MIGGGIFAALGVVAQITHAATWIAFVLAGVVAFCAAYSYNALNAIKEGPGGGVTFVRQFHGSTTLAGMVGWTLLFGYIGSMAMYAYAFGSYFVGLAAVPDPAGIPLRPLTSVTIVAAFVGLNYLGARATGSAESVLVGVKVAILLLFGLWGLYYGSQHGELEFGLDGAASFGPIMAAAVSFVAFQGWQLLFYDQERIDNPAKTIKRAVYISIPAAVFIYVIIAVTTLSLAPPHAVRTHPERALAIAAEPFLGHVGFVLISVAALFSTGSAINATLFSSGYFAKGMLSNDLLPDQIGDPSVEGAPRRTLLVLGALTAAFSVAGSLGGITSFASLAFIVVFGAMSYLAFRQRDHERVNPILPAIGALGSAAFFPLMFYHLYSVERGTFWAVVLLAVAVVAVELIYFEHDVIEEEFDELEDL
jgi:amino acid transporter